LAISQSPCHANGLARPSIYGEPRSPEHGVGVRLARRHKLGQFDEVTARRVCLRNLARSIPMNDQAVKMREKDTNYDSIDPFALEAGNNTSDAVK
jgi:hypothetical protein